MTHPFKTGQQNGAKNLETPKQRAERSRICVFGDSKDMDVQSEYSPFPLSIPLPLPLEYPPTPCLFFHTSPFVLYVSDSKLSGLGTVWVLDVKQRSI